MEKNYKAIQIYDDIVFDCFQDNKTLEKWANKQPLARVLTCLGDGYDGIWNIMGNISKPDQSREVLDWYHLKENLYKGWWVCKALKKS